MKDNMNTACLLLDDSVPDDGLAEEIYELLSSLAFPAAAANAVPLGGESPDFGALQATPLSGITGGGSSVGASDAFIFTSSPGFGDFEVTDGTVDESSAADSPVDSLVASASTITTKVVFRNGLDGYAGTIDTTLKQLSPSDAFGAAKTVFTDKASAGKTNERQALLGFDSLFGSDQGQIPVGATITSAILILETTNASGSPQSGTLHRMLVDWSEGSTWNSMIGGVQTDGTEASAVTDATAGVAALGRTRVDVTSSLQAWVSAGSTADALNAANRGWVITTGSTDAWGFSSSEGSFHPKLAVTYMMGSSSKPILSVADAAQTEGPGAEIAFRIDLDHEAIRDIVVSYSILGGTATVGHDLFGPATGTVTILAGQSSVDLSLALMDDNIAENTETFTLQIDSAPHTTIGDGKATGTIFDDDAAVPFEPSVVAVIDLTSKAFEKADTAGYGSGDPSGLAYDPVSQKLFIADSEHNEHPYFSQTNLFSIGERNVVEGYSLRSFTDEPTGLGINPLNGYMYISDDDQAEVFWVDPANPSVKIGSFDTASLGFHDTEDMKFDPATGNMFILDGSLKEMFELTSQGDLISERSLPSVMRDAEALAYDSAHDVFFVASGRSSTIWELDRGLNIIGTIDVLSAAAYTNPVTGAPVTPKGMELAPSSDPHDGQQLSLYVADYGVDQVNDGRLFEISLGSDWLLA